MAFILELLKRNKLKFSLFLLFSFATSLLGVLVLMFINEYLLKNTQQTPIFAFIALLIVYFLSSIFVDFSLSIFGQNFIYNMQKRVVKQILDTSFLGIEQTGKAKLLASLSADVRTISFGFLRLPEFLQSLILVLCACFYLLYLSKEIFLMSLFCIVLIFMINNFLMIKSYKSFRKARYNDDALQENYQDILNGFKELKVNTLRAKNYYENDFLPNANLKRLNIIKSNILGNLSNNLSNVLVLALVGLEFYFSLNYGLTSLENATTIALSILFLQGPLIMIVDSFPALLSAKVAMDKISNLNLADFKPKFIKTQSKREWSKICFKNVSFSYDKFKLSPINLELNKGELIFLIGKNGSGKSTFSMLLTGLFKPDFGEIYLDEEMINEKNLHSYQSLISPIFSDFHLFKKLDINEFKIDEEKLDFWLKFLGLDDKTAYKNGELTQIKLSTGQKKRLAMLVALLEERDILVLDEWAADQDPVFRRFFYTKLLPLLKAKGKSVFAITHDDAYFEAADRIFLAQDGVIKELSGDNIKEKARSLIESF